MVRTPVGAVILASSETGFLSTSQLGTQSPALAEIAGVPLVRRVVRAAAECEVLSPLVVVGGEESSHVPFGADVALPSSGSPVQDILAALTRCQQQHRALLLPGNLPFITSEEILLFLESANESAEVVYPLVPRELCEQAFSEFRLSYLRLAEGEVVMGNGLIVAPDRLIEKPKLLDRVVQLRREPWRIATMVNPLVLLAFNAGRLSLEGLSQAVENALGLCVSVTIVNAPGIAVCVRKPIDLRRVRQLEDKQQP